MTEAKLTGPLEAKMPGTKHRLAQPRQTLPLPLPTVAAKTIGQAANCLPQPRQPLSLPMPYMAAKTIGPAAKIIGRDTTARASGRAIQPAGRTSAAERRADDEGGAATTPAMPPTHPGRPQHSRHPPSRRSALPPPQCR